jgi:hypothetical protein
LKMIGHLLVIPKTYMLPWLTGPAETASEREAGAA